MMQTVYARLSTLIYGPITLPLLCVLGVFLTHIQPGLVKIAEADRTDFPERRQGGGTHLTWSDSGHSVAIASSQSVRVSP